METNLICTQQAREKTALEIILFPIKPFVVTTPINIIIIFVCKNGTHKVKIVPWKFSECNEY